MAHLYKYISNHWDLDHIRDIAFSQEGVDGVSSWATYHHPSTNVVPDSDDPDGTQLVNFGYQEEDGCVQVSLTPSTVLQPPSHPSLHKGERGCHVL